MISQQNVREARSALLPNANLSVTGVESRSGSRIAAGALNNPVIYPRAAAGVGVSQLIYDFGRTTNLLSSSEYQAKAQNELETATVAQIILAVDQAFFNALETKALVTVAQQTSEYSADLRGQNRGADEFKIEVGSGFELCECRSGAR